MIFISKGNVQQQKSAQTVTIKRGKRQETEISLEKNNTSYNK